MKKKTHYNIAIVGATGLVGKTLRTILAERQFPVGELYLLASERSAGQTLDFRGRAHTVIDLATFDFSDVDIVLFSAGGAISKVHAPRAAENGCVVIDNTSEFRYDDDVPLLIPEVNLNALSQYKQRNIIANPNCSTMQMLVALKPIYDAVGIERINVCTYQAVSGGGKQSIDELTTQIDAWREGHELETNVYPQPIAFNVLPHIDTMQANGYTREEMKMVWETQKIFEDKNIQVNPTCVRVPVINGHSEAVHIETRKKISVANARELLNKTSGVQLIENDYPTPLMHAAGNDAVYVGRVREDVSHPRGLNLWIVADNLRKGAALNAVQIAECLVRYFHMFDDGYH